MCFRRVINLLLSTLFTYNPKTKNQNNYYMIINTMIVINIATITLVCVLSKFINIFLHKRAPSWLKPALNHGN